ncbi:rhodanese-like domain-containing protein [Candidatus Symbiobacter mobilis]|uniref:Rhodanese-related sulfurtransferase n=1 Tax=Candidatus Symbiobacter mobilis CR TaxID=946483 RepID=U5N6J3_9BURK|nr:rhodanese-like domain-containing protein [Candidatus Symbiobacter mobilis]AGX86890.1 rhodanese-related sulfurtransferase [Candidatus Symbiobacter mobilis CR]
MDFVIDNWIWIAMVTVSGGMLLYPALLDAGQGVVDPDAAVMLINREKAVVVDVCQPTEFAAGHIQGSKNIPLDDFDKKLPTTVKNKSLPLILVCQSGIRSRRAVAMAQHLGYERAMSLRGGVVAWRNANLPIDRA